MLVMNTMDPGILFQANLLPPNELCYKLDNLSSVRIRISRKFGESDIGAAIDSESSAMPGSSFGVTLTG